MTPPHLRVPLTFGAGAHAIQVRCDVFLVRWNKIVRPAVRPSCARCLARRDFLSPFDARDSTPIRRGRAPILRDIRQYASKFFEVKVICRRARFEYLYAPHSRLNFI